MSPMAVRGPGKRHYVLPKPYPISTSTVPTRFPDSPSNLPLNFRDFIDESQKPSVKLKNSLSTSVSSQLLQPSSPLPPPPPQPSPLPNLTTNPQPSSSEVATTRTPGVLEFTAGSVGTLQLIAQCRCILIQRLRRPDGVEIPTERQVEKYFRRFGFVEDICVRSNDPNGFVVFSRRYEAQGALDQEIHMVRGCPFKVIPAVRVLSSERQD
ncbi:hypothetical protein Aperf_G00000028167 [Anoplocephala perfoliata]